MRRRFRWLPAFLPLGLFMGLSMAAQGQYFRGVNIAGAEFGSTHLPGVFNTDYTYNSELTFRYFAARNLNLIRFPLQWERIQPILRGPLDAQNLKLLKDVVSWSKANGNLLILDIHNFGRYNNLILAREDLADLWMRLSAEFATEPAVYAYDL